MPARDEGEGYFKKWSKLIKADKISEVLTEAVERNITGEKALECVVCISSLAYEDAQKGVSFRSPPEDILKLTEVLCSLVISQPSLCNQRFVTSLYHVAYFFFKRNHLAYVERVCKITLECKRINISIFQGDGSKIYGCFIILLKKVIPEIVANEDEAKVKDSFCLLLEMLVVENTLENGSSFLETVLHTSQIVAKQNKKLAVILISKGLQLFSGVGKIKDEDTSLSFIFKLYSYLFSYQLEVTGYASALALPLSYVDTHKWKFYQGVHGVCFHLLSKANVFMSSHSNKPLSEMIQSADKDLEKLQSIRQKKDFVKEACLLMTYFVSSLHKSKTISSSDLLGVCLESFLEMMLNLYSVLKDFNLDTFYYIQCLSSSLMVVSKERKTKKEILKKCVNVILRTVTLLLEIVQTDRSENHSKADYNTKLVLNRCANLIHFYHLELLKEEIIAITKPVCRFMCTLPSYIFDDPQNKMSLEISFTCLINALDLQQLYEVLEVAVIWLLVCPQSYEKVFRLWSDFKHNAICHGGSEFLDTTIFTIVTEGKSSLEKNWLPCNLTPEELGNLLVKELNTYFINSTLRGSPVLQASKALESLATDVVTQVKGVVVALDVTTARSKYEAECRHYHDRSKQLLATLRKQKNCIDPVEFNCSMGNLLYAQFRFKLKSFRAECDSEVLRLSAFYQPAEPLVPELPESRPDPNDTCDVTTRYNNLSLDKQEEVLADVDTVIAHWRFVCTQLSKKEWKHLKFDLRITLKNLQEAALIMKLYCDETKEGELWCLLYKLALLVDDGDMITLAVGEMLKTRDVDPDILGMAEDVMNKSELTEKNKNAFLLKRALFHLAKNEVAEGVKLLKVVSEVRKNLGNSLYFYFLTTLGQFQKLSSWMMHTDDLFSFSPSCHFSFHKALSCLLYLSQQEKWNSLTGASHIQLNLLQLSYELGEINWSMEQPREARCYLKSQLLLAQKLGLPLRTTQHLLVLAWVDLSTGMMNDCKVKLEGLEALLNLQGRLALAYTGEATSPKGLNKVEIWDPEFLDHRASCDCFVCRCTEYQRLVLETLTLRATFCTNSNQLALALQSFKVAIRVQEHLSKSDNIKVQTSCAQMWKHYSDTLVLSNKSQDEITVNKKALDAIPSTQEPYTLLQHVLLQRTCLQSLTTGHNQPVNHRIVIETEEVQYSAKTPVKECGEKVSTLVKPPLSVHNDNITPKLLRPVRKLTLPSSGEENTPPPTKSSPKSKRRIKLPSKFVLQTPQAHKKLPNTSKTPFTIVDDDGNAVGVSSSKAGSRMKKQTKVKTDNIVDPINKKLFGSVQTSSDKKLDVCGIDTSPVRKSNRDNRARTYERKKSAKDSSSVKQSGISSYSQNTNKRELKTDSEIFTFDALKLEVNKIKSAIPKSTYSKGSSLVINKNNGASSQTQDGGSSAIDSDCSMVEGTPTPPETKKKILRNIKPRRATRSNKT